MKLNCLSLATIQRQDPFLLNRAILISSISIFSLLIFVESLIYVKKNGINVQQIFSEAMARFLKFRVISLQREYSRKVMEYLKVRGTDDFESMFDRLYFVSLNDVLWVKSYNSPVKYAEINPYSNPLDPAIASLVLTGNADCFKSAQQSAFPYFAIDLSASGTQNKV